MSAATGLSDSQKVLLLEALCKDATARNRAMLAIEPEDHATKSRDYGRGFAEAIRLVREAHEKGSSRSGGSDD